MYGTVTEYVDRRALYFQMEFQTIFTIFLKNIVRLNVVCIETSKQCQKPSVIYYLKFILGWKIDQGQLKKVAELSGVLESNDDYLDSDFNDCCARILPEPQNLEPSHCADSFIFRREKLQVSE